MAAYVVTARAVQFIVGSRGFLLERGASVPEGVDEATLDRLLSRGYIDVVDELEPEPELVVSEPEPKPLEEMTTAELTELAAAEGIDLSGAKKNADRVAVIVAARAAIPITEPDSDDSDEDSADQPDLSGSDL